MGGCVAACAGADITSRGAGVLLHIAVDPAARGRGIGRAIIGELMRRYSIERMEAETDGDAAGFYRSCGFTVEELGEKYHGVTRYQCTLFR